MRFSRTAGAGSPDPGAPTLIRVEDLKIPSWALVSETMASSGTGRMLRAAPAALGVLVRLAWQTSPRLTLLTAAVELASGCATAFGLLATANVLAQLLVPGPTPQRVVAALPALGLVMISYTARGLLDAAVGAVQAVLAPRVELRAQDELHAAVIGAELVAFDDADFVELVRRTSGRGIISVGQGVTNGGNLLNSAISLAAAIVTAGLLNLVLAPVVLLAAVPNGWASMRAAQLSYESFVRMNSRMHRLAITGDMIISRRQAAEVRAFTTQDTLLVDGWSSGTIWTSSVPVMFNSSSTAVLAWNRTSASSALSRMRTRYPWSPNGSISMYSAIGSVYAATGGSYHLAPARAAVPDWRRLAAAVPPGARRQIGTGMSGR